MKKNNLIVMGLFSLMSFIGCSSDDAIVTNLEEKIMNNLLPVNLESAENLPDWLAQYVYELENSNAPTQVDEAIYQFTWQGQTMYYHNFAYSPTLIERVFYSNGTRVDWNKVNREDILNNSKDWKLIYKIIRKV